MVRLARVVVAVGFVVGMLTGTPPAPASAAPAAPLPAAAPTGQGAFVPLTPVRLLDTRGGATPQLGTSLDLPVAGTNGVPAAAAAVALNVTVTGPTGTGWVTVHPAGGASPTSTLNFSAGQTVANAAVVRLGSNGHLSVDVVVPGVVDVVVDLTGYYNAGSSSAGGTVGITPARLYDSRQLAGPVAPRQITRIQVGGTNGIPANAAAAIVNLTVTGPESEGWLTAYADGPTPESVSSLNFTRGQTVANLAVVPLAADGSFLVRNTSGGGQHMIVDVTGWVVGGNVSMPGGYVSTPPQRTLDTRTGLGAGGPLGSQAVLNHKPVSQPVLGVVVNLTVTESRGTGYVTAYPAGAAAPVSSNVNMTAGSTVANLALVGTSSDGTLALRHVSSATSQLIVDLAGYYMGSTDTSFSFLTMPDTQMETGAGDVRMTKRVTDILDNRASRDSRWVLHNGDLVNWDDSTHSQFELMSKALAPLFASSMKSAFAVGNHDSNAVCPGGSACPGAKTWVELRNTATFNRYFPPSLLRYEGTYESGKSDSGYVTSQDGGLKWLLMSVELWPRPEVVEWARQVIATHPDYNVVVVTHMFLEPDNTVSTSNGGYGSQAPSVLWSMLRQFPNVQMVFGGHAGDVPTQTELTAADGHKVIAMSECLHDTSYNPTRSIVLDTAAGTVTTRVWANWDRRTNTVADPAYPTGTASFTGMRWVR